MTLSWTMAGRVAAAEPSPTSTDGIAAAGLAAYESGRYEEANERLSRALDLVGVPTLALYAARTNVKLGNWVKASELYLLAARLSPKSAANIPHLQAQYEAERERAPLLARIPRLTIVLEGEDLASVEVTLDSVAVPNALLGANQLVDPGHHVVRATRDGQVVTGELELLEQQHKTTRLHFARREAKDSPAQTLPSISTTTAALVIPANAPNTTKAAADGSGLTVLAKNGGTASHPGNLSRGTTTDRINASLGPPTTNGARSDVAKDTTAKGNDNATLRTLGWVGIGVGGTGLVVGTVTGLMAVGARSDLTSGGKCVDSICSADASSDISHYNRLRNWSTVGFLTGGLFAATGLTLLLLNPTKFTPSQATLAIGPGSARVLGTF